MKEILLLLAGILIGRQLMAQTFSEWFRQNHTQLKYLAEQIAALRSYDGVLRQGYTVAGTGLDSIGAIGAGDLSLHTGYFNSLGVASAGVRNDPRVDEIENYCLLLLLAADDLDELCGDLPPSPWNGREVGLATSGVFRAAAQTYEECLEEVRRDGRLQMDDAGRIARLDIICGSLKRIYASACDAIRLFSDMAAKPMI